jgi:hypothetical protein
VNKPRTNKSTIRNDPFATVIPLPAELDSAGITEEKTPEAPIAVEGMKVRAANTDRPRNRVEPLVETTQKTGKQKLTVHLEPSLADRVKNAAYWNPKLTIAGISEQGIRLAIEKIEREHGGKYPPREGELVGGRPIK